MQLLKPQFYEASSHLHYWMTCHDKPSGRGRPTTMHLSPFVRLMRVKNICPALQVDSQTRFIVTLYNVLRCFQFKRRELHPSVLVDRRGRSFSPLEKAAKKLCILLRSEKKCTQRQNEMMWNALVSPASPRHSYEVFGHRRQEINLWMGQCLSLQVKAVEKSKYSKGWTVPEPAFWNTTL